NLKGGCGQPVQRRLDEGNTPNENEEAEQDPWRPRCANSCRIMNGLGNGGGWRERRREPIAAGRKFFSDGSRCYPHGARTSPHRRLRCFSGIGIPLVLRPPEFEEANGSQNR